MKKWFFLIVPLFLIVCSFWSVESVYQKSEETSTVTTQLSPEKDEELAGILREAGIVFFDEDLIDYAGAEEIPLLIKYDSPVVFGLKENTLKNVVDDLTSSPENVETINNIKNAAFSVNGKFKTSYKTISWTGITIPRGKIKDFKSLLVSTVGNKLKRIEVEHKVRLALDKSIPLINADRVWQLKNATGQNITGKDITILFLDSGINYTHPDFGGCTSIGPTCKVIGGYDYANLDNDPMDEDGHGTHVAGIAAGNGILKGVAPDAKLIAYKVCKQGDCGSIWGTPQGNPLENMLNPLAGIPDVISMSIETAGDPNSTICDAINEAVRQGIVVVAAATNNGPGSNTIKAPGLCEQAITVGAVYKEDYMGIYKSEINPKTGQIAPFSSRGPVVWTEDIEGVPHTRSMDKPDVVAPGVLICSARTSVFEPWYVDPINQKCVDDYHVLMSGTSMATPFVSGAVALIKQVHHDWGPETVKSALMNAAVNLGYDKYTQGSGLIDVFHAIEVDPNCYRCL